MPDAFASDWPDDIKVDVLPPVAILRARASEIGRITKGILKGEVSTTTGAGDMVSHRLDLVAPALNGRRYGVLNAIHRADLYPVLVEAECFKPPVSRSRVGAAVGGSFPMFVAGGTDPEPPPWPDPTDWRPVANNEDEFVARVREVLRSGKVRAAIDTLLALSNEKAAADETLRTQHEAAAKALLAVKNEKAAGERGESAEPAA
ncbi:MAG: hypothetical protein U0804_19035 [Gemmataceae bacterium]